ncbi:MAG: DEAD/DEAH box helicase, partial [Desulfovibrio sp.]|nr:DEAD/DEAH box helicase [Desulfovibrio sp.]
DRNFLSVLLFRGARIRFGMAGRSDERVLRAWHRASRGFPLVQRLFADLLCRLLPADEATGFERGPAEQGLLDFGALACDGDSWNRRLSALEQLVEVPDAGSAGEDRDERLVWIVDWRLRSVRPASQRKASFGWGQARMVSPGLLARRPEAYGFLDMQDVRILEQVAAGKDKVPEAFALEEACVPMDGCPRVFEASGQALAPLALRQGLLAFRLNSYGRDMCRLAISDPDVPGLLAEEGGLAEGGRLLVRRGAEIVFYSLSGPAARMLAVVGKAYVFPAGSLNRVLSLASRLAPEIPVEADIEAAYVASDPTPVLQLEQVDAGFAAQTGVRPFSRPDTPFYPTGAGVREPFAMGVQDGEDGAVGLPRPVRTRRDFAEERSALAELAKACPALGENLDGQRWSSSQPDDVLELLTQLGASKLASRVEWPKGAAVKVSGILTAKSFHVRIEQSDTDWFGVSGEVEIAEDRFLSIQSFLRSLKGSRFVELGDGDYVALTEDLRRKLTGLQLMLCEDGRNGFGVNPLALKSLEQAMEGMQVDADAAWTLSRERMSRAFAASIAVPRGLKAELRDYQREGYEWLQRLALWGVGACLADDMGLGKTLQTIACMLGRAKEGPCLVVAPTSVCGNWETEIARFAPSLKTKRLGQAGREKAIAGMRKGGVLVVGYGLLPFIDEELAKVEWSMLVLDEAQALKNAQTRRARSARMLRAGFKCALTGTPIENRIDDLWSIFSIVNPGLLGSWDSFRKRWGGAQAGSAASRTLRALVRPFILRRLKSAVLPELPPRTEQTLVVEPTDEERAFYEAERRKAVDRIASLDEGRKRFDILASLMKLRRACCHPSLADPDMAALEKTSSKTERFLEIAQELIGAGHKLLAFSQFTSYLRMVEEALKERGVSCLYLDVSTPEKERWARVKSFQTGGGDVFLLSLKAGGTGINLTAADYVVHLDPWWNPAVEDQASDRAYRLGQQRPVTIYRLVMAGTVEEKILAMHERKRELAADFLEGGAGGAGPLTEQELLDLLQ